MILHDGALSCVSDTPRRASGALQTDVGEHCPQRGDLRLECSYTLLERVMGETRSRHIALGRLPDLAPEQLRVPLLLLTRTAAETHHELTGDEPLEGLFHLREPGERMKPIAALLQLAGRLRAAEHEHAEDRGLVVRKPDCLLDELPVLDGATALTGGESRPLLAPQPLESVADRLLVVVDNRIAIRGLVARETQRIECQWVGVRRRPLLLDQATEHPDLDGVCIHGHSLCMDPLLCVASPSGSTQQTVKLGGRNADVPAMATSQTDVGVRSVIETARLRLEPWDDAHFEHFARFMSDPEVTRYIRPEPLGLDRAIEQHERSLEEWELLGFGKRAIIEAETDQWLGFVELSQVGPGKGSRDDDVELGYFVKPSRWGQGIATEAAIAARDEAFDRCGVNELIGRCRVENAASARVLAKVGFRRLRLFELDDRIVVEIHRIQRAHWTVPPGRRERTASGGSPSAGADYRETG